MNADLGGLPSFLWLLASSLTIAGLAIYATAAGGASGRKNFHALIVLAWVLIPALPLAFVFAAFPGSTTEGELWKFKVGGAFASYVLLWFGGVQLTGRGVRTDEERKRVARLEQIAEYVTVIKPVVEDGVRSRPLIDKDVFAYSVVGRPQRIAIITGDLANIREAQIWVNSENTNMQMARFGDRAISSTIRYLGAKKSPDTGLVVEDTIAKSLAETVGQFGQVAPGFVVVTGAGELERTNGVRLLFHVASVAGEPASGYRPVGRIQDCVTQCLRQADDPALGREKVSILFPLMGTGTGGGHLEETVERLLKAAITYLQQPGLASRLDVVYFLAANELDLAVCRKVLAGTPKVALVG